MLKKIILIVVAFACVGGGIVAYEWFKPHPKPKNGIQVTATNLAKEFGADEKAANTKYLDKPIEVTGTINEATKNQDSALTVVLDTGDPMSGVQCTLSDKKAANTKGQTVTVTGFCSGYNLGYVSLRDCIVK